MQAAEYAVGDLSIDGRFEVLAVLGEGAYSKVYRVRDEVEGEERAFKLFHNAAGYEAIRRAGRPQEGTPPASHRGVLGR